MATFLILLGILCFLLVARNRGPLGERSRPLMVCGSICLVLGVVLFVVIFVQNLIESMLGVPQRPLPISPLSSYSSR